MVDCKFLKDKGRLIHIYCSIVLMNKTYYTAYIVLAYKQKCLSLIN